MNPIDNPPKYGYHKSQYNNPRRSAPKGSASLENTNVRHDVALIYKANEVDATRAVSSKILKNQDNTSVLSPTDSTLLSTASEYQGISTRVMDKKNALTGRDIGSVFVGDNESVIFSPSETEIGTVSYSRKKDMSHGSNIGRINPCASTSFHERHDGIFSVRFCPGTENAVLGFGSGALQIRNARTGGTVSHLHGHVDNAYPIMSLRFNPRSPQMLFAASAGGDIHICDTNLETCSKYLKEEGNQINCLDINLTGEIIASAGEDLNIRLYDLETKKLTQTYLGQMMSTVNPKYINHSKNPGHANRVFAIRFHPDFQAVFVSGGWDSTIKVWDIREKDGVVKTIVGPHICGDSVDVKNNCILSGSWAVNFGVQLWDLGKGELILNVPIEQTLALSKRRGDFIYTAQFWNGDDSGNMALVGGSARNCVQMVSLKEAKVLDTVEASKAVHALDTTKRMLVFGGADNIARYAEIS